MRKENLQDLIKTPSKEKWRKIGLRRRTGVLVPLFSVYSKDSIGIGDLDDLKLLIDWCDKTGLMILQLLPMNEVGSTFCPYDALSSFALEPSYLSLRAIHEVKNGKIRSRIADLKKNYPAGRPYIDYRIKELKLGLLREIYLEDASSSSREFKRFTEENSGWLDDFALFKVLKNYHRGKPWYEWEDRYKYRDLQELEFFRKEHEGEILFEKWVQFELCRQFRDVKAYAESKKILLKGDLPILVSRDSADVWASPEFFKLEFAAGAPPDMYCAKGQRWGMPTYNWEEMSRDGYRYLRYKLKHQEQFYDILRIDHVVGLFRIWSIPYDEPLETKGLNGFFDPKDEGLWGPKASRILQVMLESTKSLLCAEDLGVIPRICPETLKRFGVPGNDVQRWTKDWKITYDFLKPEEYRLLSVAMLSTHDTTNWPAWWTHEAGTVDEALFMRKLGERGIDFNSVKVRLFSPGLSRYGRLRWKDDVTSPKVLADIIGKQEDEIRDLITIYKETYREKDKLWKALKLRGPMREGSDREILKAALEVTLESNAIFCIETIMDLLCLSGLFEGDPYLYRINTPGTVRSENWSLTIPISLERLLKHKLCKEIKDLVTSSGRI